MIIYILYTDKQMELEPPLLLRHSDLQVCVGFGWIKCCIWIHELFF